MACEGSAHQEDALDPERKSPCAWLRMLQGWPDRDLCVICAFELARWVIPTEVRFHEKT